MDKIEDTIKSIEFPIHKDQLIQELGEKGMAEAAPILQKALPSQVFNSAEEVLGKLDLGDLASKLGL